MDKKERYLALSKEIIAGKNPERRILTPEDARVFNFIKGIRAINRQEFKNEEPQFFETLFALYKATDIPLLRIETTNLLFKKHRNNKVYIPCMLIVCKKLKNKDYTKDPLFWEMFLDGFTLGASTKMEDVQPILNEFVKFAQILLTQRQLHEYKPLFRTILYLNESDVRSSLHFAEQKKRIETLKLFKKYTTHSEVVNHCYSLFHRYDSTLN
jgi:hypothetical protein